MPAQVIIQSSEMALVLFTDVDVLSIVRGVAAEYIDCTVVVYSRADEAGGRAQAWLVARKQFAVRLCTINTNCIWFQSVNARQLDLRTDDVGLPWLLHGRARIGRRSTFVVPAPPAPPALRRGPPIRAPRHINGAHLSADVGSFDKMYCKLFTCNR